MTVADALVPMTFFISVALIFISRSEIGKAFAQRIRGGTDRETQLQLEDLSRRSPCSGRSWARPRNDSTLRSACWPKAAPQVSCRDGIPMTQGPGPDTLVPIFGMITGLITTGLFFWGIVKLAQSQVGSALARRIQGHSGGARPSSPPS
jgi:hypothetical protein